MNAVSVIFPYRLAGVWVFDDASAGLVRHKVAEVPEGSPGVRSKRFCHVRMPFLLRSQGSSVNDHGRPGIAPSTTEKANRIFRRIGTPLDCRSQHWPSH